MVSVYVKGIPDGYKSWEKTQGVECTIYRRAYSYKQIEIYECVAVRDIAIGPGIRRFFDGPDKIVQEMIAVGKLA